MTGYLLDSHALLWWLDEPARLGPSARAIIAIDPGPIWVSIASIWEIAIKPGLGRLRVTVTLDESFFKSQELRLLQITATHALKAGALPRHHRDPFDRMLVAQAMHEDLVLITADAALTRYDVRTLSANR